MRRRMFLKGAGVITVLVVGGGVWRAYDQGVFSVGEGPAYEPWKDWRANANDGPLALIRAAILAASPHNTQPWLFRVSKSRIELYADIKRTPGALDPYLREQHIGLGCALENLMLAAAPNGYKATASLLPGTLQLTPADPQPELVARVELEPGPREPNELYDAIPHRHTNRNPYDVQKAVPTEVLDAVGRISDEKDVKVFLFTAEVQRNQIVTMIDKANDVVYANPEVEKGSEHWIRLRWSDVQKYRDGLTLDADGQPPLVNAIIKTVPRSWLRLLANRATSGYAELLRATPVFGLIAVRDRYDQQPSLLAGRIWQRIHLLVTTRGIAGRPVNEAVELVDQERWLGKEPRALAQLAELTGDATWQPTFMFRLGYAIRPAPASPRRPVNDVVSFAEAET